MIHELKTMPEYFEAISNKDKTFEVRKADRPFKVGDFIALNEYTGEDYTGRCMLLEITYILDTPDYCKPGYVILGIEGRAIVGNWRDGRRVDFSTCLIPIYYDKRKV